MRTINIFIGLTAVLAMFSIFGLDSNKEEQNVSVALPSDIQKIEVFDTLPAPPDTIPGLTIINNGKKENLRMDELIVNVEVMGNISRTTMEMSFENKSDRILEGELNFPLGEGQTVTRFALDVNGKMREGVVVEKAKGQQVFEAVIRKNIDPGLLEKTKGNNFKARVYPIPANGNKRMIIAYEQELIGIKSGNLYILPLQFKDKLDKFSVNVEVFKQKTKPVLEQNELANFEFTEWNDSYIAKKEFTNYVADKQLGFVLPETKNIYSYFIEKSAKQIDNDFFYVNIKPEKYSSKKELPKTICLLYDASSSLVKKDIEKELNLLDEYFKTIGNLNIQLIIFSNEIHSNTTFAVKKGNWEQLKEAIVNSDFDGATQLGCLDLPSYTCNEFILMSDGISSFGNSEIKLGTTPVIAISSTQSADFSTLNYIASATGGHYLNLQKITIEQALNQLKNQSYHFISATYNNSEISQVYPSTPCDFNSNFSISGQIKSDEAEITLNFGFGDKIIKSEKIRLNKSEILQETNLVSRIWAQKKISELDMLYDKNKEEITELGKKYNIVTRNTSLIVLDRLEDYVQYEIVPPVELQKEYFEIVESKQKERINQENQHIEQVIGYFNQRTEWWNKNFPKDSKGVTKESKIEAPSIEESSEISYDMVFEDAEVNNVPVVSLKKTEEKNDESDKPMIQLNAWDPGTPYMTKIKAANPEVQYKEYLNQKKVYTTTPSFYLDAANYFEKQGKKKLALRILSNIAEMEVENHELMRILAHRLEQLEYFKLAISVYEEVLKIRPEEPQSYRDLSLCLASDKQYQKALDILYGAIKKPWDGRFPEIEGIMAVEMNRIISRAAGTVNVDAIDKRLIKDMPVDIRIVLNWDTDNSDMDLWVTDPYGEKCYYSHAETYTGGRISRDFTGGYGPEEFLIKEAIKGKYIIQSNYYGSSSQRITGPTTIYLEIYTNYGRKNEKKETITMQLSSEASVVDIGQITFGDK
jgi:hypothetical protein